MGTISRNGEIRLYNLLSIYSYLTLSNFNQTAPVEQPRMLAEGRIETSLVKESFVFLQRFGLDTCTGVRCQCTWR